MNTIRRGLGMLWVGSLCLLLSAGTVRAADTEAATAAVKALLGAVQANDYEAFVAQGTAEFKAGLTKPMLEGVSEQLAPRMKQGYEMTYLGDLKQHGHETYLWKLSFKDGGDDTLARLVMKDGKVAGFWLQ